MKSSLAITTLVGWLIGFIDGSCHRAMAQNVGPKDPFSEGLNDIISHNYLKAIDDFTVAANNGNSDASFNLGLIYFYGEGTPVSYKNSAYWMIKSADEGNVRAEFNLIWSYQDGNGVPKDYDQAAFWQQKVTDQGYDDEYNLSEMFSNGSDRPNNHISAIMWTRYAAEHGDAVSEEALALNYGAQGSFPNDVVEAFHWHKKAALQGIEDAQVNLASAYWNAQGTPESLVLAYEWEDIAASQGDDTAAYSCAEIAKKLTPQQLIQAKTLADNFKPQ